MLVLQLNTIHSCACWNRLCVWKWGLGKYSLWIYGRKSNSAWHFM